MKVIKFKREVIEKRIIQKYPKKKYYIDRLKGYDNAGLFKIINRLPENNQDEIKFKIITMKQFRNYMKQW